MRFSDCYADKSIFVLLCSGKLSNLAFKATLRSFSQSFIINFNKANVVGVIRFCSTKTTQAATAAMQQPPVRQLRVVWAGSHTVISPSLPVYLKGDLATKSAALQEAVAKLIGSCLWFGEVKAVVGSSNKELTLSPASWKPYFEHYRKMQSTTRSVFDFNQKAYAARKAAWEAVLTAPDHATIVVTRYPEIESAVGYIASGKCSVAWHRYTCCSAALQRNEKVAAAALDAGMAATYLDPATLEYPSIVVRCIQKQNKVHISQQLLGNKPFVQTMLKTFDMSQLATRCVFCAGVSRPVFLEGQVFYDCIRKTLDDEHCSGVYTRAAVLERVKVYGDVVLLHTNFLNDNSVVLASIKSAVSKDLLIDLSKRMRRINVDVFVAAARAKMNLDERFVKVPKNLDKVDCRTAEAVVSANGLLLQYMSVGNRDNKRIVLAACKSNGLALRFASERMQHCRSVVLAACKSNGNALKDSKEHFRADQEIVLAACRSSYGAALRYASDKMRSDKTVVMAAINSYNTQLIYYSYNNPYYRSLGGLLNDPDVVLAACMFEPHLVYRLPKTSMNFALKAAARNKSVFSVAGNPAFCCAVDERTRVLRFAAVNWQIFALNCETYNDTISKRLVTVSELNAAAVSGFKNATAAAADCLGYTTLNAIKLLALCKK